MPRQHRRRTQHRPTAHRALGRALLLLTVAAAHFQFAAALAGGASGEENADLPGGRSRCGHEHDDAEYAAARQTIAAVQRTAATNPNARAALSSTVTVPIQFHVITMADGTGNITMSQVTQQIAIMNSAYGPSFQFYLQNLDFTVNNVWYTSGALNPQLEVQFKTALHQGGADTVNIYTLDPTPYLGYTYYPTILANASTAILDGLMIHPETLPGGSMTGYNLGGTIVHECGHWLLLSHTFQGGCSTPNDFVTDTPPEDGATSGCPTSRKSCDATMWPGADPIHNFMDYSSDACYTNFTPGQVTRMQWAWITYRASGQTSGSAPAQEDSTTALGALVAPPATKVAKTPTKKKPTKKKPTKKKPTKKRPTKKRPTKKRPTKKRPTRSRSKAYRIASILQARQQSVKLQSGLGSGRRLLQRRAAAAVAADPSGSGPLWSVHRAAVNS